eukprot:Pgem_evm1s14085
MGPNTTKIGCAFTNSGKSSLKKFWGNQLGKPGETVFTLESCFSITHGPRRMASSKTEINVLDHLRFLKANFKLPDI